MRALSYKAYGNWRMLNPNGDLMCLCDEKRARWYIKRELAVQTSEDPPTFQLIFTPNGPGHANSTDSVYYLSVKHNNCVVCNAAEVTKHHVVPYQYRQHFPLEYKSRRSHDVVLLCPDHHAEYEELSLELQNEIAAELGIPVQVHNEYLKRIDVHKTIKMGSIARALTVKKVQLPEARRIELLGKVADHLGRSPTDDDLRELIRRARQSRGLRVPIEETHGYLVARRLLETEQLDSFVLRWRQHFVDSMNPNFLSEGWSVYLTTEVRSRVRAA